MRGGPASERTPSTTASLLGLDAVQLVSRAGLVPAGDVVDTDYTMVGKLPKAVLGNISVYGGLHGGYAQ